MHYGEINSDEVILSIVMPVYNTEQYLRSCLYSILRQIKVDLSYEIICVDDGSTDTSLTILQEMASVHDQIRVYSQENARQGAARNNGLRRARGTYVWFIDSDDYITEAAFSSLSGYLHDCVFDVVGFSAYDEIHKNLEIRKRDDVGVFNGINNTWLNEKLNVNVPFHIFKRKFLQSNNLLFLEKTYYEDIEFILRLKLYRPVSVVLDNAFYVVRHNEFSTTRNKNNTPNKLDYMNLLKSASHIYNGSWNENEARFIGSVFNTGMSNMLSGLSKSELFVQACEEIGQLTNLHILQKNMRWTGRLLVKLLPYPGILRFLLRFRTILCL